MSLRRYRVDFLTGFAADVHFAGMPLYRHQLIRHKFTFKRPPLGWAVSLGYTTSAP